ncbi:MAG TPA: putative leader peptide [Actinospica sp.]|nr:putative leader peptide [Actinospica sp.]
MSPLFDPTASPREAPAPVRGRRLALVSRRHVDFRRTASAICRG